MLNCPRRLSGRFRASYLVAPALLAVTWFMPLPSVAQVFTATLSGVVADPSNAAIPGAVVTIRNTASSESRRTTSSADGRYTFSQVPPAAYEVSVEAKGFKRFV